MEHPKISVSLSLDPATHSFRSSYAPTLVLTIVLNHHEPITIYADDLSPQLMLKYGAFDIHYRSSGAEVRHSKRRLCRFVPPTKVAVKLNENLFHTLLPYTPLILSTAFNRTGAEADRPRPAADPGYLNDASQQHDACGVDGLEPGHEYVLTLASNPHVPWTRIRWWEYGTKDDVLRSGNELDARTVLYKHGPHEPITIDTSSVQPVASRCEQ